MQVTRLTTHRSSLFKLPKDFRDTLKDSRQGSPMQADNESKALKRKLNKSNPHMKDTGTSTARKEDRFTNRKKLLQSLNDLADQLTKPSITQEEQKPEWLQKTLKEEAAKIGLTQTNLGKPSSRQDAILLGKWFKGVIDMIEEEYNTSKQYYA